MNRRTFGWTTLVSLLSLPLLAMKREKPPYLIKKYPYPPMWNGIPVKYGKLDFPLFKPTIIDELDEVIRQIDRDKTGGFSFVRTKTHYIAVTDEAWVSILGYFRSSRIEYPHSLHHYDMYSGKRTKSFMTYKEFDIHITLPPNTTPRVQMKRKNHATQNQSKSCYKEKDAQLRKKGPYLSQGEENGSYEEEEV